MKKAKHVMSLMIILGVLAALPASAQVEAIQDEDGCNLGLLITINRLELTTDQMQQIRDILVGVLDEANTLKESRDAFEQEMLNLRQSITNCQECFEDQRRIYADSYRSAGAALPQCLKEAITVEIAKIGDGDLVKRLQEIDKDFNEQKSAVKDALKPITTD